MKSKEKGIATILVIGGIMLVSVTVALISKHYMGDNNPVELAADDVIDETLEEELHLAKGSVHVDL